jgi:retinol-binding protein 3
MKTRLAVLALCFAAAIGANAVGAQAPAARAASAPTIPSTPAGSVLRTWLDAFNSGDSARMDAYYRKFQPSVHVQSELPFREQTGGFDLLSIERSEPRHIEFTVKERKSPMVGYGVLDVSATEPLHVTDRMLQAIGPDASVAATRIDAATRARVIDGAIAQLDSFYVFPAGATRMSDSLHARLARGVYDRYDNGITFAARIRDDLHEVMHDKHLGMNYSLRPLPPAAATGAPRTPSPEDIARQRARMDEMNCGFDKAEVLDGNVGYLKFDFFADADVCGPTASAAMNFLAGTRALIIDLRENGGGSPGMVAYVASYLLPPHTHINDLWTRATDSTEKFFTRDSVPGRHYGADRPVYVLTSHDTFSGGEEFTYDLKTQKRATIIGETTGGGAHPVRGRRIDEHFMIGVPFARAINPITHTNWEGTGVEPDVKVPADQALTRAKELIRKLPAAERDFE